MDVAVELDEDVTRVLPEKMPVMRISRSPGEARKQWPEIPVRGSVFRMDAKGFPLVDSQILASLLIKISEEAGCPVRLAVTVPAIWPTPACKRALQVGLGAAGLSAAIHHGRIEVHQVSEPIAAVLGAGLDPFGKAPCLVANVGDRRTEVFLVAEDDLVAGESMKLAGDAFDEAILRRVHKAHGILVSDRTAERIKIQFAAALPLEKELSAECEGRDAATGDRKKALVNSQEVREGDGPLRPLSGAPGGRESGLPDRGGGRGDPGGHGEGGRGGDGGDPRCGCARGRPQGEVRGGGPAQPGLCFPWAVQEL